MLTYILKRLIQLVPVLFGITLACFFLLRALPGDPATLLLGARGGAEEIAAMKQRLGLDLPLWRQYLRYLGHLAQGDLGRSYIQKTEVSALIASRLPATLQLMAAAICVELLIGLTAGILAATRRGRASDFTSSPCNWGGSRSAATARFATWSCRR
jgi:peptide/nickel transport system permease protein